MSDPVFPSLTPIAWTEPGRQNCRYQGGVRLELVIEGWSHVPRTRTPRYHIKSSSSFYSRKHSVFHLSCQCCKAGAYRYTAAEVRRLLPVIERRYGKHRPCVHVGFCNDCERDLKRLGENVSTWKPFNPEEES